MDPLHPLEPHPQRGGMVVVTALGDCFGQQLARGGRLSLLQERVARVEHFLGAPLAFGDRRARAVDVGAGARVRSIQEQHPGPEVDGFVVPAVEIFVETVDKECFDLAVTLGGVGVGHRVEALWISHQKVPRIISATPRQYKRDLERRCGRNLNPWR